MNGQSRQLSYSVAALLWCAAASFAAEPKLLEVTKIWDKAPHNAFTDLVRFKDQWYCAFREGKAHVSADGALRVLVSDDGRNWASAALLTDEKLDLRDAKLSVTPDNKLMMNGAGRRPTADGGLGTYRSMCWVSDDGRTWSAGTELLDDHLWVWRLTWHKDVGYGLAYSTDKDRYTTHLYSTRDGRMFDPLVRDLFSKGHPNEHAMAFLPNDTALCLLRRDGQDASAQLGSARPPYKEWTWKDLGVKVGGPAMIRLPDGRLIAGVRLYDKKVRTSLCWLDAEKGTLTEFLPLPSGGDSSYPGLVLHDGVLYVSYYSSHEGKSAIYLAKVSL